MSIERKRRDAYQPDDREKDYFPEGTFIVVGFIACLFGLLMFFGFVGRGVESSLVGLGLLVFACMIFAMRGVIGALYDIREYQARRAKWVDNESDD